MRKRIFRRIQRAIIVLILASFTVWFVVGIQPAGSGKPKYIRFEQKHDLGEVLNSLTRQGYVKDPWAARLLALFKRSPKVVPVGSYSIGSSFSASEVLASLRRPIELKVRIPETNWALRTSKYLAQKEIVDADDYMNYVKNPSLVQKQVDFSLPKNSLEGYLYPDTYDLPPLIGASAVIDRQLKAFEAKAWPLLKDKDVHKILTVASLVELESGKDTDRAIIAGVIYNRLKKKMPLQIDASLLYGIQKWRRLKYSDYKTIDSPYNLYTHKGLPPGPICSPTVKSIEAALNPAKHDQLYYIAIKGKGTLFSKTYKDHLKKVKARDDMQVKP